MSEELAKLVGKHVVVDTDTHMVYLGRLEEVGGDHLALSEVDAHSIYDSHTSREIYVMEARKFGVRHNRGLVIIRMDRVVSVSPLDDVIEY
jgi:small nuclear ribonucleoprotein (snRNP)-like protein